jgi:hypothetical protein
MKMSIYDEKDYAGQQLGQDKQAYTNCAAPAQYSPEQVIDKLFTYQPPTPDTLPKFLTIREAGKYFAKVLVQNVPGGTDRLNAIIKVREAVMLANAAISLGGEQL